MASCLQYRQYRGKFCTDVVGNSLISFLPQLGQISHLSLSIILLHMFEFVNSFFLTQSAAALLTGTLPLLSRILF